MKHDVATRWIEALRSEKYKQGKGQLRSFDNRYCCLGVLCDIQGLLWKETNYGYTIDDRINTISADDWKAWGINIPELTFIELNDDKDYTFDQIGDFIEDHIKGE